VIGCGLPGDGGARQVSKDGADAALTIPWSRSPHRTSFFSWDELELVGPYPGDQVLTLEKKLKRWLRREVGLVPGTRENWFTARMEVQSLAELKARSGVETDLF